MGRIYYGWAIVAIAVLTNGVAVGTTYGSFALYVLPVSAEFHLSRADINTALILMNVGNAVIAPLLGRLLDRTPIGRVMALGALAFLVSFGVLGLSHSLLLGALTMLVGIPTAFLAGGGLTNPVLLARWFRKGVGRAMALAAIGMLLGAVLIPPAAGALIDHYGWRTTLMIIGVASAAIILPLVLLVRDHPRAGDIEPGVPGADANVAAAESVGRPIGVGAVLRSPAFWLVTCGVTLAQGMSQAMSVSFIPLARDNGASMLQASSILSASGLGGAVGLLLTAAIADRVDRIVLLVGLVLAMGALNAALLLDSSYPMLVFAGAATGATAGVITPLLTAVLADLFGAASMGTVSGLTLPFTSAFGVIALRFAGEVFDRTGGYRLMFVVFAVSAVVAAVMLLAARFTGRPRARAVTASLD